MDAVADLVRRHPYLTAWVLLAVVMVGILLFASQGVGLLPNHLFALVVATVLLAGACVWIITWE
jgi:predicted tellurium resistance membrane protein TerC